MKSTRSVAFIVDDAARSVQPHFLLTDIVMPNMNGIELAIQIQQLYPGCKVLLSSGQSMTAELLTAAGLQGQFTVLQKPVHPLVLLEKIEAIFADTLSESHK